MKNENIEIQMISVDDISIDTTQARGVHVKLDLR